MKDRLGHEAEGLVQRPPLRRGIEPNGLDRVFLEMLESPGHERPANPSTPQVNIDEHHRDPGHASEATGRDRAHHLAMKLGDPTAVGLQVEQPPPVGGDLIPTSLLLKAHPVVDVTPKHGPNLDHDEYLAFARSEAQDQRGRPARNQWQALLKPNGQGA